MTWQEKIGKETRDGEDNKAGREKRTEHGKEDQRKENGGEAKTREEEKLGRGEE